MRTLLIAALALPLATLAPASGPGKAEPKSPAVKDWKADPACRLVFFAVLQGLYEDGVSDEVVNSVVPPGKKGEEQMRHSFVLGCPLCRPAFEAFRAYQGRPRFAEDEKGSTFGKGLPKAEADGLMAKQVSTRLIALRKPMKRWVEARLVSMKLDEAERKRWWDDLSARAGEGSAMLRELKKRKDPWYKDWSDYWGCAACLGSQDACREVRPASAAKPK
jgi:hypothetical protein